MTKKTFAPFELKMTEQQAIDGLKSTYGDEFTAADVRAFASMNDIAYATVTKKIKKYRVAAGKWNLKVTQKSVENIEKSFKSPAAMPAVEKNLVPTKIILLLSLVLSQISKGLLDLNYSILYL